ncbi:hypothetical protein BJV77DRAFT_1067425 [Russula vinacea]|nr:hypothetical protein BJV77DRAFT_1067425 [Russula vinacea]
MPLWGKTLQQRHLVDLSSTTCLFQPEAFQDTKAPPVTHGRARLREKDPEPETKSDFDLWNAPAQIAPPKEQDEIKKDLPTLTTSELIQLICDAWGTASTKTERFWF